MSGIMKYALEIIMFLYFFTLFAYSPSSLAQVQKVMCNMGNYPPDKPGQAACNSNALSKDVATWATYNQIAAAVPALFTVTFQGALADSFGRKPAMIVSIIGTATTVVGNLVLSFVEFDVWFLFVGQAIYGLCGTYAALLMAVLAAAADQTTLETRTLRIGILEGCILAGLCCGSLIGGLVSDSLGLSALYFMCVGVLLVCAVFAAFMPETLAAANRQKFVPLQSNAFSVLKVLVSNKTMAILSIAFVLNVGVAIGALNAFQLYTKNEFNMSLDVYGYLQATLQFFRAVGLLVVLPLVLHRYKHSVPAQCMCGIISAVIATGQHVLWGTLNQHWWLMFVISSLGLGTAWTVIVIRGLMSRQVGPDAQGKLMGAIAVLEACIIPFAMTALFNSTFSATVDLLNTTFFFVGAACFTLSGCLVYVTKRMLHSRGEELRPLLSGNAEVSS